jgi:hypothetical protein
MTTSRRADQPPYRHRPASTEHLDRAIQYSEASAMESEKSRRTGYPAFAGYDATQ